MGILQKRLHMLPFLARTAKTQVNSLLHAGWKRRPPSPRAMCLFVTYRCNLRCRICGIWQGESQADDEFSLPELDRILSDPLFTNLEFVNLNGGEPNLRNDLPDIVALLLEKLPRLRILSLNSNGIPAETTLRNVDIITELLPTKKVRFSISLSLHAVGEAYDRIAGVQGTYVRVNKAFKELKKLQQEKSFFLSANCVISNLNLEKLDDMLEWGKQHDIPVNFTLGEIRDRFLNEDMATDVLIDKKDQDELIRFFRRLGRDKSTHGQHALRYSHLADMLETGKKRSLSCHYYLGGLILGADGTLSYCKWSPPIGSCREDKASLLYFAEDSLKIREEELRCRRCPVCPPNTFNEIEAEHDLLKLISFLVKPPFRGNKKNE